VAEVAALAQRAVAADASGKHGSALALYTETLRSSATLDLAALGEGLAAQLVCDTRMEIGCRSSPPIESACLHDDATHRQVLQVPQLEQYQARAAELSAAQHEADGRGKMGAGGANGPCDVDHAVGEAVAQPALPEALPPPQHGHEDEEQGGCTCQ
jgi:hypothetical protein